MSTKITNQLTNQIKNELTTNGYSEQDINNSIQNVNSRLGWNINSSLKIYSRSKKSWFDGKITDIFFTDEMNEEWLVIKYRNSKKEVQRFNTAILPIGLPKDDQNTDIIKFISNKLKENEPEFTNIRQLQRESKLFSNPVQFKELLEESKELSQFDFTDLSIFEMKENDPATVSDPCTVQTCKKIKRLLCGLQFYTALDVANNADDQHKFDKFMRETYKGILNDYLHFTQNHSHDLEKIYKILQNSSLYQRCDINTCRFTDDTGASDTNSDFYKQTMDSLHFYLFHQYDTGLKTAKMSDRSKKRLMDDEIEMEDDDDDVNFVDKDFERMQKIIKAKKGKQKNMMNKDKFSIKVDSKDRTTYIDGLFKYLRNKRLIDGESVTQFENWFMREQFDTDTLLEDMNNPDIAGNIDIEMKGDKNMVAEIKIYVRTMKTSKSSFSVGIRFYYWPFFKDRTHIPKEEQRAFNQNDHAGYSINELYVAKKYATFKEEISEYEHIAWTDYQSMVVTKANNYIDTDTVKASKSAVEEHSFERLHYDIDEGTVLGFQNLISLILYTDFSALCTDFSSTFRKVSAFETLSSVISRNQKYYWMSKTLRETVECFGQRGCGEWDGENQPKWHPNNRINKLKGPFFTGMGCVMIMPEFNLRLCSPTSTSIQIQIAINFSGDQGIIIQLNNDKKPGDLVRGFNCSWISRFKHEEERLFFGGFFRIKIEGIRLRATNENFYDFFQPLFYLDALITGTRDTEKLKIDKKGRKIISKLIAWKTEQKEITYHQYIMDTFASFCTNKKNISLDLFPLSKAKKEIVNLIMHGVEKDTGVKDENNQTNLFRKSVFDVFENVTSVEMDTFWWNAKEKKGKSGYSVSLLALLSIIESTVLEYVTVKVPTGDEAEGNWLTKLWADKQDVITQKYKEKNYKVKIKHVPKKFCDEDWFVIKKVNY